MVLIDAAVIAKWQNPITSVASLMAGLLLSVAHHVFYSHLNGHIVSEQPQFIRQWSVSIGTGFAFLAHSALSISIGITFWQLFWSNLHKKPLKLSTIDSLADSWGSLPKLLNFRVIRASPILVFLGLTATVIIPVAVVFPPGTLRVRIDLRDAVFLNQTTTAPAWEQSEAFAMFSSVDGHYLGPRRKLVRASAATAYQMNLPVLPKIVGIPNATYELRMYAPTVQCQETSSDMLSNFTAIFQCSKGSYGTCGNEQNIYTYLAWAPLCNGSICAANTHTDVLFNGSMPKYVRNIGTPGYGPAQMYISTLRGNPSTDWKDLSNWQTLNCSLYNASQVAKFVFNNDESFAHFESSKTEILDPVTLAAGDRVADNTPTEQSYLALMDTLGGLLAGSVLWKHEFQEWLIRDTVVADSKLVQTAEISHWSDLTDNQTQWTMSTFDAGKRSLAGAIEELFHNMTLSLFAHDDFIKQTTVDVVHSAWHATHFEYYPTNLVIAYGFTLFLTAIVAVIGYLSVLKEGKSFSNRLSTVIRIMQNDELYAAIDDEHRGGEDPLPKELAKTKVQISRPRASSFAGAADRIPMTRESKGGVVTEIRG